MSRPALPRASFLGGSVAPASAGTVSVPLKNPALEMQAQSYGSLAQRLNAFSQQAFGIAETRAKKAGQVYGITNAPTLEQVESAAKLGQPVEVEGDISSTRAFDQAAYAGSMAVVESHYATAAQKAMTDIFVRADADNTMTPAEVQMQMQAAVTEYTMSLSMLDASSAAKLTNKLGVMANSKYVEFSRSYANRMQKKMVDDAVIAVDDHLDKVLPPIIKGYDATNSEVGLDTSIRTERGHIEGTLKLRGVGILKRNEILDRFDKLVIENKIDAIVRMADNATGTDPKADVVEMIKKLKKGNADESKQEIYNSLDPEQRRKALGDLFSAGTAMKRQLGEDEDAKEVANTNLYNNFQKKIYDPDFIEFDELTNKILKSNLPPRGELGKQSLLEEIQQRKKEFDSTPTTSGPTTTQVENFNKVLDRINLPPNHRDHVTAEDLRSGKVKIEGEKLDLPITGLQGNNLATLINRAEKDESLQESLLKSKKDHLYNILKAAIGAENMAEGGKSHAADTVYRRARQELENIFQKEVAKGNILELLERDMFKKDTPEQLLTIARYRNRLPTIQQSLRDITNMVAGKPQAVPRSLPLPQFLNFMKAFAESKNYTAAASFLSKPEVFNRPNIKRKGKTVSAEFTAEEAKDFIENIFGITP